MLQMAARESPFTEVPCMAASRDGMNVQTWSATACRCIDSTASGRSPSTAIGTRKRPAINLLNPYIPAAAYPDASSPNKPRATS